jgi:hypothetical protein
MILNKKQPVSFKLSWSWRILLLIVNCSLFIVNCFAETRYVSKDGSSTPPYTSWETASDSIQKAINICNDGDTIYVANGVYKETLIINTEVSLIGLSRDSTIIDGTGLPVPNYYTIIANKYLKMENFHLKGIAYEPLTGVVASFSHFAEFNNLFVEQAREGIYTRGGIIINSLFTNLSACIATSSPQNNTVFYISNNIMLNNHSDGNGILNGGGGDHYISNNLILGMTENLSDGIDLHLDKYSEVKNNLIANYNHLTNYYRYVFTDSAIIMNNIFIQNRPGGRSFSNVQISFGNKVLIRNNIFMNSKNRAINAEGGLFVDYNLFWKNPQNFFGNILVGENNVYADPMLVNDTIPLPNGNYDFYLQKYSPAIDAGDPDILDVDGSRSDIGLFGGPLGEEYTYQDLAPRNPQNLSAVYDDGVIKLNWNKNSEADLFRYRVYRDTVPNFIYDTTKIIAEISDTLFNDNLKSLNANSYYYKITAIDSGYNQSPASEEITVVITGLGEIPPQIVEEYNLMQNYPNPFNPTTKITYRIKEPGYVKLMVYNLLGEIVEVLVNEYKDKGFYEAEFTSTKANRRGTDGAGEFETMYGHTASGIYLYRIEVIGKGNIPVFSDMKKMILVK